MSTRTTNVELSPKRHAVLKQKLFSLARLLPSDAQVYFDVVVRHEHSKVSGDSINLSVKLTTSEGTFMTVAIAKSFRGAVNQARLTLRRQLAERSRVRQSVPSLWQARSVQIV